MELLESLNNLQPAGAGRADTKARELRLETEQLRRFLVEAEVRSSEVCRRASQSGPVGAGERRLSVELSRFQPELLRPPQQHQEDLVNFSHFQPELLRPRQQHEEVTQPLVGNQSAMELWMDKLDVMLDPPFQEIPAPPSADIIPPLVEQHETRSPSSVLPDGVMVAVAVDPDATKSPSHIVPALQTIVVPSIISPLLRDTVAVAPQSVAERATISPSAPDHFLETSMEAPRHRPIASDRVSALSLRVTRRSESPPNKARLALRFRNESQQHAQPKSSPAKGPTRNTLSPMARGRRKQALQRKLPTDSAIRQAFIAIDRSGSGRLTKDMFINGLDRKELRSLLAHGFGTTLLTQPYADLMEDLEFIFEGINDNLEVFGEPCAPEFVFNLLKLMKRIQPLLPESPRLHLGTKMRWTRLIRSWRRKRADTSIRLPLLALQRLVKRVEAAENFVELPAELSAQMALVDRCDWQSIPSIYLLEVCSDMARIATALPRFTACDDPGYVDLVKATQRLRSVVLSRVHEFSPHDLVEITIALLPAPLNEAPLEQRTLIMTITSQVHAFSMSELAALARMFDGMGGYDYDFFMCAARCIHERTSLQSLAVVAPTDVAALVWLLARYRLSPCGGDHPLEVLTATRTLCSALVGFAPTLCEADLARLIWGLGHLSERPYALTGELGNQVAWRARRNLFSAREYSRVAWGLAVLGVRPLNAEAIATNAAHAVARADAERNPLAHAEQMPFLDAPELAQLAAALGAWAVNDTANVKPLWTTLRRRLADFTGEELLMAVTATVSLGIRDDALIIAAEARALVVGPFDAEGTRDFLQCLQDYAHRFGSEKVRDLAATYAVQAFKHTSVPLACRQLAQCVGPSPILAKGN